jgi:hypothetical protein
MRERHSICGRILKVAPVTSAALRVGRYSSFSSKMLRWEEYPVDALPRFLPCIFGKRVSETRGTVLLLGARKLPVGTTTIVSDVCGRRVMNSSTCNEVGTKCPTTCEAYSEGLLGRGEARIFAGARRCEKGRCRML